MIRMQWSRIPQHNNQRRNWSKTPAPSMFGSYQPRSLCIRLPPTTSIYPQRMMTRRLNWRTLRRQLPRNYRPHSSCMNFVPWRLDSNPPHTACTRWRATSPCRSQAAGHHHYHKNYHSNMCSRFQLHTILPGSPCNSSRLTTPRIDRGGTFRTRPNRMSKNSNPCCSSRKYVPQRPSMYLERTKKCKSQSFP